MSGLFWEEFCPGTTVVIFVFFTVFLVCFAFFFFLLIFLSVAGCIEIFFS